MQIIDQTWVSTLWHWFVGHEVKMSMTYISWSRDFAISWRLFVVWTSYFGIMSQYDQTCDLKINVGHCNLYFMVQWFFLPYMLKTLWCLNINIWDYDLVWPDVWPQNKFRLLWPIIYFMVQWVCLISWTLFDVWTSYFGTYISWPCDFVLYLEDYLMYEHHTLGLWASITWYLTSK